MFTHRRQLIEGVLEREFSGLVLEGVLSLAFNAMQAGSVFAVSGASPQVAHPQRLRLPEGERVWDAMERHKIEKAVKLNLSSCRKWLGWHPVEACFRAVSLHQDARTTMTTEKCDRAPIT